MTDNEGLRAHRPHPTDDERGELEWLRVENELLRTQRDVLERIAIGFAEDLGVALPRGMIRPDGPPCEDTR
ncbi:hypothetical protein [Prauserella alba]|uniref:Transposase n=1 Tax=Prauserella alba TaxID=176898 RepID=A0ABN1VKC1_9PSEU|nr:hypothetical protein [Prauserella alba]MCP2181980.1 hypothetical protein [Prauserella alba]